MEEDVVEALLRKARQVEVGSEAMHLTQAALNAANARKVEVETKANVRRDELEIERLSKK